MNSRTLATFAAFALLAVGLALTVLQLLAPPPLVPTFSVAVAGQAIEPYAVITQDMIAVGDPVPASWAAEHGAWRAEDVVGKMAVDLLAPGDLLSASNAQPVEDVRFTSDLGLEVVSFAASVDRTVGGQLRPGHLVNLYGFHTGREEDTFTTLIESRLWVVAVSAGGSPVSGATPQPAPDGELVFTGDPRERPATLVTVAVPPSVAYRVIDALGAQGLEAWLTLAANSTSPLASALRPSAVAATGTPDTGPTRAALDALIYPSPVATLPDTGLGGMAP